MKNRLRAAAVLILLPLLSTCGSPVGSQSPNVVFSKYPSGSIPLSALTSAGPVLLIFWASWCPSCVSEAPEVQKLYEQSAGSRLQVYGVNAGENKGTIEEFIQTHHITYPILMDEGGSAARQFNVSGLPTIILLAKGGKIIYYGFSLPPDLDSLLTKENHG